MLAARMEEYYLQAGEPDRIKYISKEITEKLRDAGLVTTAHHVRDYLEDKYKLDIGAAITPVYAHASTGVSMADIDEIRSTNVAARSPKQLQVFHDYCTIIENEKEANRQQAIISKVALDEHHDYLGRKHFDPVHTPIKVLDYRGPVYDALREYTEELGKYHTDMVEVLKDTNKY